MSGRGRTARARWVVLSCALGVLCVGILAVPHAVRHVRESRAIEALRSQDEEERKAALQELVELRSVRGIPAILSTMPSDGKGERGLWNVESPDHLDAPWEKLCVRTIHGMGVDAIPSLRRALGSPNVAERFWSVRILLRFSDKERQEAEQALYSLLDDSDPDVRLFASIAVGLSAATSHRVLESLVTDLQGPHSSANLRIAAAGAVGIAAAPFDMRSFARMELKAALEDAERDPSPEMTRVMRSAALALLETARDGPGILASISMQGLNAIGRRWSFEGLDLKGSMQVIVRRELGHEDVSRRLMALYHVEYAYWFDLEDESLPIDVLEILGTLLLDANEEVRAGARRFLSRPDAVPVLLRVIARDDPAGHLPAMEILESMREPDTWSATLDRLSLALASREPETRRAATGVLAHYHASRSVEASVLAPLLHDDDDEVVSRAALALSSSGNLEAEVFDTRVLKLLDRMKPLHVRMAACNAAKNLGPKAGKAVPALIAANGDAPDLAAAAIEALAVISPEESIPLSIRALGHESRGVRDAAVTALWTVGSAATSALPALQKLTEGEKDLDLATRATTLIRRLEAEEGRSSRVPR